MIKLKLDNDSGIEDYEKSFFITDDNGNHICDINKDDGERIVKCVNSHDDLVNGCEEAYKWFFKNNQNEEMFVIEQILKEILDEVKGN